MANSLFFILEYFWHIRSHTRMCVSRKYLIVHNRKTWTSNSSSSSNDAAKNEMANALNGDVYYYIFVVVIPFTVSMICDNFMCHFLLEQKIPPWQNVGCVRPFMFDARVYLCSFFAACSFIWFLTARVHLSIKNTVDKHKCLNENNEYGLPIMILRVCTLWQRVERLFFVQMKNVYKILWRWIGTKIHTYLNICTHTRTHRGAKLLDVKNKGVCALCKQKAKKCTINFVNST